MQDNRITEKSSGELLKVIGKNAKEVNLASNSIGIIGCEKLSYSLIDSKC